MALSTVADTLLTEKSKSEKAKNPTKLGDCVKGIIDAVALVGAVSQELNIKRREQIKPDLNVQYRQLCTSQVPITSCLFGDDLPKTLKDIAETNRVRNKVSSTNHNFKGNSRHSSNYKGKSFLGHRKPQYHNHRYSQNSGYKSSGHNNNKPYKKDFQRKNFQKSDKQE